MEGDMSITELQERQSWTLHQKIDHTVGAIEAFVTAMKKKGNGVYVSFSGGKDSTVLLDICRRYVDKDMLGVFCNTGNEYPSIVQFVRQTDNIEIIRPKLTVSQVLATYGFPLVSKEQSQGIRQVRHGKSEKLRNIRLYGTNPENGNITGKISEKWKFLIDAPFDISEKCCDCLKKRPFSAYEKKTNRRPILGTMAVESRLRIQSYVRRGGCNSFKEGKESSHPMSIWTDTDVWAYIRRFDIPYADIYDMGANRTGCAFCGFGCHKETISRFWLPFELYPKMYNLFMKYENNGVTFREALHYMNIELPDDLL